MYQDANMIASIRKVEAAREANMKLDPRRMTAEEKDILLKTFHPDYREDQFVALRMGPNKGEKVPKELAALLEGKPRLEGFVVNLECPDYETDVLIIGGGGAGCSAAIEADENGAKVMVVTKLRVGDANTMMAEGGIQAADKANDSPAQHFLDAYGGGHFAAQKDLLYKLVTEAPEAIQWLSSLGVEFDKAPDGTMITTHGGGTSRKRMHAAKDYSGAEIMRTLRDEVLNRNVQILDYTAAIELIKDDSGCCAGADQARKQACKERYLGDRRRGTPALPGIPYLQSLWCHGGWPDFGVSRRCPSAVPGHAAVSPHWRSFPSADLRSLGDGKGSLHWSHAGQCRLAGYAND